MSYDNPDPRIEAAAIAMAFGLHAYALDWWAKFPEFECQRYREMVRPALVGADAVDPLRAVLRGDLPTDQIQKLRAENEALRAAIAEHDAVRAELSRQQENRHEAEWQQATEQINSLQAEVQRVTALGAQWAQEREDAREQLGREMATVDDMARDLDRAEAAVAAAVGGDLPAPTELTCGRTEDHLAHDVPMTRHCVGVGEQVCDPGRYRHLGPWEHVKPWQDVKRCIACGTEIGK